MNGYTNFENKFFDALMSHYTNTVSVKTYLELLKIEPENSLLLYLLSHAYFISGDKKISAKYYKNAVSLNSNITFTHDYSNVKDIIKMALGTIITKENPFKDEKSQKLLNFKPVFDSVFSNCAMTYRCQNDYSNSVKVCKDGLEIYPNSRFIKWIYGGTLLKTRFMEQGWKFFDDRVEEFYFLPKEFEQKEIYNFQSTNKPVYLHFSGGFGDTIFMARYLPLLKEKNIKFLCEPQKSMYRLFKASGFDCINHEEVTSAKFDYRISFLNLPGLFKTDLHSIPYPNGFLKADEKDIQEYREKYFKTDKKKIGIIWNTGKNDTIRKIELKNFIPLFQKNKDYQFYSLQYEITEEEKAILENNNVINLGKTFKDWEDTASALANLDIYLGCDTSVSNLAGAMGIKSYILVLDFCEWRWGTFEETTPWFTSTKVYRQKGHGNWDEVMQRIHKKLKK